MNSTAQMQTVQFLNDKCSPSDAHQVITKIIDDQIEFYKLQNLSHWIKNDRCDQTPYTSKIAELKQKRQELIDLTKKAKLTGTKLKLSGDFQMHLSN